MVQSESRFALSAVSRRLGVVLCPGGDGCAENSFVADLGGNRW